VACQFDTLRKCRTANAIRKALDSLPKTLDLTYERILLAIDGDDRDVAIAALRWLCFSTEVWSVQELAEAAVFSAKVQSSIGVPSSKIYFDVGDRFRDPLDILRILSGLVVLTHPSVTLVKYAESYSDFEDFEPTSLDDVDQRSKIILSHFSVREYLVSDRLRSQVSNFAFERRLALEALATSCIHYLSFYGDSMILEEERFTIRRVLLGLQEFDSYPLFYHAHRHWVWYSREAEDSPELTTLIISCLESKSLLKEWLVADVSSLDDGGENLSLHVASCIGLYYVCLKLISGEQAGRISDLQYRDALYNPSIKGHEQILRLLLEPVSHLRLRFGQDCADVDWIVLERYEGVAQKFKLWSGEFMLDPFELPDPWEESMKRDNEIRKFGTALEDAIMKGDESLARLLLQNGPGVNAVMNFPLHTAAFIGSKDMVFLCLKYGALVNIRGGEHDTALHAAVYAGNSCIVEILLNKGEDVCIKGADHRNALDKAIILKDLEIAVMLLKAGAVTTKASNTPEAQMALKMGDYERYVNIQVEIEENSRRRRWARHADAWDCY